MVNSSNDESSLIRRIDVVSLRVDDIDRYMSFRRLMLQLAPWAFSATPDDDLGLDRQHLTATLDTADNKIFAVAHPDDPSSIAATVGLHRKANPKFRHRAVIWGVFVHPDLRGRGFGRATMSRAIDEARSWAGVDYLDLCVSTNSPEAYHLYQNLGFREWGREPEATDIDGERYDEVYMTLRLRGD
jgi:ribosomal protein S18 acetylase RimI-like enzyme